MVYDLVADPGEQHPLDDPALLEQGRRLIEGYQARREGTVAPAEIPISEEAQKRLKALGYVH